MFPREAAKEQHYFSFDGVIWYILQEQIISSYVLPEEAQSKEQDAPKYSKVSSQDFPCLFLKWNNIFEELRGLIMC